MQNSRFNEIMRELKKKPSIARPRLLNLKNPKTGSQTFYSKQIIDELANYYTTNKIPAAK
jgi:hypothetical protein